MPVIYILFWTLGFYITGMFFQYFRLSKKNPQGHFALISIIILAFLLHGFLLYHSIDLQIGQNLSILNLLSFAVWLVVLFAILMSFKEPVDNLFLFVLPLAALSIALVFIFPEERIMNMQGQTRELIHIFSAATAFAVVSAAAIQVILLAVQNYLLKHQSSLHILSGLPPLEVMEKLLFRILFVGFLILSWVVGSSFYFFDHLFLPPLLQKTVLTIASWAIFAVLLVGRYKFGWRGKKVVYYTLAGFILLILIYTVIQSGSFLPRKIVMLW